jgi:acyl-CoA reductase-like NAD-dependent aldehyde dehydrogenase
MKGEKMGWLQNLNKKLVRKRIALLTTLVEKQEESLKEATKAQNGLLKLHAENPFDTWVTKTGAEVDKVIKRLAKDIPKNKEELNNLLGREDNEQRRTSSIRDTKTDV